MKQIFLAVFAALFFAACNNDAATPTTGAAADTTKMNTDNASNDREAKEARNKQIVEASLKSFENGGNMEGFFKDVAPDIVDYGDGSVKPVKGIDSLRAFLKMWMTAIPDYKGSDFTTVADGDNVVVYGTWSGTWKSDLMGAKATGKSFKVKDADLFKLSDDGKILEHRNVVPMGEIARQIGMKMPAQ